nr:MAG: capsid protein [Cressdnaviricota sp.]
MSFPYNYRDNSNTVRPLDFAYGVYNHYQSNRWFYDKYGQKIFKMLNPLGGSSKNKMNVNYSHDRHQVANEDGASNVVSYSHTVKHQKGVSMKKRKLPHVDGEFKKKVAAALKKKEIYGTKTDIYYATLLVNSTDVSGAHEQFIDSFNYQASPAGAAPYSKWDFLPEYFLDAASCLFNDKTVTNANYVFNTANTIGTGVAPVSTTTGLGEVEFTVVDSHVKYFFRNDSQHIFKMFLYECAPKRDSYLQSAVELITGASASTEVDALIDASTTWKKSLADDASMGSNTGTYPLSLTTWSASTGFKSVIGHTPFLTPGWRESFSADVIEVVLEPGASYEYFMQGPSNFEWRGRDHAKQNAFVSIKKYSRYLMPVVYTELCGVTGVGNLNSADRAPFAPSANNQFVFERSMHCKIKMPEETGFIIPASLTGGTPQGLGLRAPRYVHTIWGPTFTTPVYGSVLKQTEAGVVIS